MLENQPSFSPDYFGRKQFAQNLCELIHNQDTYQSRVISIKSDFGYGKTYFAKAFKNMIDSQDKDISPSLYCHYIDIWKEDYNHNPLLALLSSLNEFVGKINSCNATMKDNLANATKTLGIELLKTGISYLPAIGAVTSKAIEATVNYENTSIFKDLNALKKIATMIQEAFAEFKNHKIIIIIDEIDRCHPEYAIDFLETLKHFFDLENLYFVLMMNENHLREKVKSKFGYIDFNVWKDKFINLEFELPNIGISDEFVKYLIDEKYKIQNEGEFQSPDFVQKNLNKHMDSAILKLDFLDYCLKFLNENKYQWNHLLKVILKTSGNTLNNRQLDSILLNLKIALDILGEKPIFPSLLLGIILKNYIPIEKINIHSVDRRFIGNYTETTKAKKIHFLQIVFNLKPHTNKQSILDFDGIEHIIALNQDQLDNILAAQFASQRSKTQLEIDYENAIF